MNTLVRRYTSRYGAREATPCYLDRPVSSDEGKNRPPPQTMTWLLSYFSLFQSRVIVLKDEQWKIHCFVGSFWRIHNIQSNGSVFNIVTPNSNILELHVVL
jgi:hypothetical protein